MRSTARHLWTSWKILPHKFANAWMSAARPAAHKADGSAMRTRMRFVPNQTLSAILNADLSASAEAYGYGGVSPALWAGL